MTANDRIRNTAHAVARVLGGSPLSYFAITAVVIYAHESVCEFERWELVRDEDLWRAAREGADELREQLSTRARRQAVSA